ncbi:hypothetical protein LOK49_LG05G01773 [Camellia lanceoleosa]|uniref:Uncharacterized protein n=1 Tax=Camellia lanceoleosa TaxID=1840588 RepID=A0ACC0HK47_9ERIC|nr:hypothetical protein LOK49_LG05G01773 [Camellia lanceoleosa]
MALFIAAAACPYLLPKPAVKPLQRVFILIAFPLVGCLHHVMRKLEGSSLVYVIMQVQLLVGAFAGVIKLWDLKQTKIPLVGISCSFDLPSWCI